MTPARPPPRHTRRGDRRPDAGIGHSDAAFALASAPLFQSAGIPFVTSGATSPIFRRWLGRRCSSHRSATTCRPTPWRNTPTTSWALRNVAVWTDNAMDYTTGLSKSFKKRFTKLGGAVALEDVYMTSDQDFSALVARLQSTDGIGGLFASSGPDTAGIIVRQVREAGLELPILDRRRLRHRIGDEQCRARRSERMTSTSQRTPTSASRPAPPTRFPQGLRGGIRHAAGERLRGTRLRRDGPRRRRDHPRGLGQSHRRDHPALAETSDYEAVTGKIAYVDRKPRAEQAGRHHECRGRRDVLRDDRDA